MSIDGPQISFESMVSSTSEPISNNHLQTFESFSQYLRQKDKAAFIRNNPTLLNMTADEFIRCRPDDFVTHIAKEGASVINTVNSLRMLAYFVAYKTILHNNSDMAGFRLKGGYNKQFAQIQEQIDALTLQWLTHTINNPPIDASQESQSKFQDELAIIQADLTKRDKPYTNLQVLRGSRCNAGCKFCFIQRTESHTVDKSHLANVANVHYRKEDLFLQMLHARMAYKLDEILFTSYGDPLENVRLDEATHLAEKSPFQGLCEEIATAKEVGFPQITLLTNGLGLSAGKKSQLADDELKAIGLAETSEERDLTDPEQDRLARYRIDRLVEAGLTNLTVSIHTKDAQKWENLIKPRNGVTHAELVEWIKYAGKKAGLTTRINVAYSQEVESASELIDWARDELGIQQITFVEMIPGNQWAMQHKRPLPTNEEMQEMQFQRIGGHDWGIQIWKSQRKGDNFTAALCFFGNNNPEFANQQKNLELVLAAGTSKGDQGSVLVAGNLWDMEGRIQSWKV